MTASEDELGGAELASRDLENVDILDLLFLRPDLEPIVGCNGPSLAKLKDVSSLDEPRLTDLLDKRYYHVVRAYQMDEDGYMLLNNALAYLKDDPVSRWSRLLGRSLINRNKPDQRPWSCCGNTGGIPTAKASIGPVITDHQPDKDKPVQCEAIVEAVSKKSDWESQAAEEDAVYIPTDDPCEERDLNSQAPIQPKTDDEKSLGQEPLTCPSCQTEGFKTIRSLLTHGKKCPETPDPARAKTDPIHAYKCVYRCGYVSTRSSGCSRHERVEHYICHCGIIATKLKAHKCVSLQAIDPLKHFFHPKENPQRPSLDQVIDKVLSTSPCLLRSLLELDDNTLLLKVRGSLERQQRLASPSLDTSGGMKKGRISCKDESPGDIQNSKDTTDDVTHRGNDLASPTQQGLLRSPEYPAGYPTNHASLSTVSSPEHGRDWYTPTLSTSNMSEGSTHIPDPVTAPRPKRSIQGQEIRLKKAPRRDPDSITVLSTHSQVEYHISEHPTDPSQTFAPVSTNLAKHSFFKETHMLLQRLRTRSSERPSTRTSPVNPRFAGAVPFPDNKSVFQLNRDEGRRSFSDPHSLSPPQALLVPENLFRNIKVYFEKSCRNLKFDDEENLLTPTGAKLDNTLCSDFDSYCFTATMLLEKGLHVEFRHALSKACAFVEQILRAEHPRTLACFLEVLIHLIQTGHPEIASCLCDYIKSMSAVVSRKVDPWGQICRLLGELDSESLDQAMAQIWKCTTDIFDSELGTSNRLAVSVRLDYMKRVITDHLEEERLLRNLLDQFGGIPRLTSPRVMLNLAHNLNRQGRHNEAEEMALKVSLLLKENEIYTSRLVEMIECLKIGSRSQFSQGKVDEAEQVMRRAIQMMADLWGIEHSWVTEFKNVLEDWLRLSGREKDANILREEIQEVMGKDEIDE